MHGLGGVRLIETHWDSARLDNAKQRIGSGLAPAHRLRDPRARGGTAGATDTIFYIATKTGCPLMAATREQTLRLARKFERQHSLVSMFAFS